MSQDATVFLNRIDKHQKFGLNGIYTSVVIYIWIKAYLLFYISDSILYIYIS